MGYNKKTDENHKDAAAEFRAVMPEATLHDVSGAGRGFPDFVVGWKGRTFLFELKNPDRPGSKKTPAQVKFFAEWQGHAAVVHSAAEMCAEMAREMEKRK